MDSLENSNILKLLGLDEKNKWILQDEKAQKFFEYIANNLDESNILTDVEIKAYEDLKKAGLFLEGDELENELKNIESTFPGFFSVNDIVLQELEEQAKQLESEVTERSERLLRMQDCENEQQREIIRIEKENQDVLVQQKLFIDECTNKTKELANHQKLNSEKIAQLKQIYTQPQTSSSLLYQMPLDQYYHNCNQLLGTLEIYMRQNFKIHRGNNDDVYDDEEEMQIRTIHKTKKEICEVSKKKFDEELNIAGMDYIIENINKHKAMVSTDYSEMRSHIEDMTIEKENLEAQLIVLQQEGQMLVEQIADHRVLNVFNEFYREKNKRVVESAEKINKVHDLISDIVFMCELLWIGMQIDLDRLKNRVDNSEEMNHQAQECNKRIHKMKLLAKLNPTSSFNQHFHENLQKLLIENLHYKRDQLPSIEICIREYMSFEDNLHAMMQLVVDQKQFTKVNHVIKRIDDQTNILRKFIFSGPTKKPCLYDPKFNVCIYDKKQKRKELDDIYQELKKNFQMNIFDPFNNDKYYRMKTLLYIWFCSDHRKVLLAIKEVQKKAAEEGSASFKALNITIQQ